MEASSIATPVHNPEDIGSVKKHEFSWADFRQHPDPEIFDSFLGALAKAVAQMPVLEFFMLMSHMAGNSGRLYICYYGPGKKSRWSGEKTEDREHRKIYYVCKTGMWVPEPKTSKGLKRAGFEKYGGEAIERFLGSAM